MEGKIIPPKKKSLLIETLASEFPGVFIPLIELYTEADTGDGTTLKELEKVAEKLLKNRRHADILQRRSLGETLQQIGSRYGVTRERIRQLASRYQKYTTDADSKNWIEKSIRTLTAQNEDEKRLPTNEQIQHFHPRLERGLVKHFASKSRSPLTPNCRVEVAENLGLDKEYELTNHPTRWSGARMGVACMGTSYVWVVSALPKCRWLVNVFFRGVDATEKLSYARHMITASAIRQLIAQGQSDGDIGRRFGVSRQRVHQLRMRAGIPARPRPAGKQRTPGPCPQCHRMLKDQPAGPCGWCRARNRKIERFLRELREFAQELGKPDLMPKQLDMMEKGRRDLRGAVSMFGGQKKVAEMAGLHYQGPLVSPDGGRRYWTDERVKRFLHQVAERNGHPGVMPTQKECREFAPNPKTVVSGVMQAGRGGQSGLTWYETAQKYGLRYERGRHRITMQFVKDFVKSLGPAIYSLEPAEIYVLFEQQGISRTGAERTFDKLVEAIQSGYIPREEIERWSNGEPGELVEALLDPEIESVEEAFSSAGETVQRKSYRNKDENPSDEPYRENIEEALPVPPANETLDALRIVTDIQASSDREAVQFLIAKAASKLWHRCFQDEDDALAEAKKHSGNVYSDTARNLFIEEYTRSKQLPVPEGYDFRDLHGVPRQPKLMQRLIAYRVLTQGRVLNLSGTGTGKTLSAVLASRVIGANLTVVSCPNATVDAWKETILTTFPRSEVVVKPSGWQISRSTQNVPRYVVVNHEMFQNRYEGRIKRFILDHPFDFVVIDELHKVKQRKPEQETQRRRLLAGLITDIPDDRPNPRVLGMCATPVVNNLQEGRSLIELVTGLTHEEIGSKITIQNCMRLYRRLTTLGFRMLPKHQVSRDPKIYPVNATPCLGELLELGKTPHPQKIEAILVKARWPIIRRCLRKKTVVFTEYVADIVPYLADMIEQEGFTVGQFTGEEKLATEACYKNMLHQFIEGETDVLIASIRTLGTGVDGLQSVCNNIIFASLPWTSTDYEQAIGRFDREGFCFDSLDIHIPKTYAVLSTGAEWSWCEARLSRIENKRDIARASVDGEIPDTDGRLSATKATEHWMGWLRRLDEEGLQEIERREIKVPLDESDVQERERRYASYGEFASLNARWNRAHSSKTHTRLTETPEEWCYYHTRLLDLEKSWQVNPRLECVRHLEKNLPRGSVVGDFGCGQGQLAAALKGVHTVYSLDHVAIRPDVISCDMAHTPLEDEILDAVCFSLSLMGSNISEYVSEAYRTLKLSGQIIIWHPAEHHDRSRFVEGLKTYGFAIVEEEQVYKWHRILAIKQARRSEPGEVSF